MSGLHDNSLCLPNAATAVYIMQGGLLLGCLCHLLDTLQHVDMPNPSRV